MDNHVPQSCADRVPVDPTSIPDEDRQKAREYHAEQAARQQELQLLQQELCKQMALVWAILGLIIPLVCAGWDWVFRILFAIGCSGCGFMVARYRIGYLAAIGLYAVYGFGMVMIGFASGAILLSRFSMMPVFFGLLMFIIGGGLTGMHITGEYEKY